MMLLARTEVARGADAVGAERIEYRPVPERRRVVAAEAHLTPSATQADRRTTGPGLARGRAGVRVQRAFEPEAGGHATAEVFRAAEPEAAAVDTVLRQLVLLDAVVVDVAGVDVDDTEQGDRRLSRCGTSKSAQHCESEQRFFHCDYLLG
jgi:hypothetical protein